MDSVGSICFLGVGVVLHTLSLLIISVVPIVSFFHHFVIGYLYLYIIYAVFMLLTVCFYLQQITFEARIMFLICNDEKKVNLAVISSIYPISIGSSVLFGTASSVSLLVYSILYVVNKSQIETIDNFQTSVNLVTSLIVLSGVVLFMLWILQIPYLAMSFYVKRRTELDLRVLATRERQRNAENVNNGAIHLDIVDEGDNEMEDIAIVVEEN